MQKQELSIQDTNALEFFGADHNHFESQVEKISGHDPRLLAAFRKVRARYLEGSVPTSS